MNGSRLLFVMALTLATVPLQAAPLPLPLASLYRQHDEAASRRDAVGCMKICTPDFAYFVGAAPPLDYSRAQLKLIRGFSALRSARVTTVLETFTPSAPGATVLARETTEATLADPPSPAKSVLIVTRTVRDFWQRTPAGAWKMKRRRLLATSATVNGLLIRTNTPPSPQ